MDREKPLERKMSTVGSRKMEGEGDDRRNEIEVTNYNNKACTSRRMRTKTTKTIQQPVARGTDQPDKDTENYEKGLRRMLMATVRPADLILAKKLL